MLTIILHTVVIMLLTTLLAVFSYVYRLFAEDEHRASRRVREHLETFRQELAPRLRMERRKALQTYALLAQLTLVLVALAIGYAAQTFARSLPQAVFETAFFVVLEILLMYQFVPYVLLNRSSGSWLVPLVPILRVFGYIVTPMLLLYEFSVSLLHLTEEEEEPELPGQAIAELVEEAQERGIFEKDDVALIASVIQFADKTAREVMTPRPDIAGIAATASVAELRRLVREKRFSRVPVLGTSLDDVKGVVFVRDLLEVPEAEAEQRRVGELMRPVIFVPETMPVVELTRQLQRETQEMAVVVDEYGSVAGLLTMEDLAEEILGEISDADQVRRAEIIKESETSFLVRGGVELERLRTALGMPLQAHNATTFAGVVHEWFGRVPKPGEGVERDGLRVEVLEATPRRVVRLRVIRPVPEAVEAAPARKRRKRTPAQ
ncbi:MAG TPA: hemolysin family protein [Candidatus Acidoferrales bacterium]|nr:hemolysin family protein [Candidatus Acidoferrales bacterium]